MIELYDVGRTTHKSVPGMYEFIVDNAERYVQDLALARQLKEEAAQRELPGHSILQNLFTEMCRIWVKAYRQGAFPINQRELVYHDTPGRFEHVKNSGRKIGVLTSASLDFTKILFDTQFLTLEYNLCRGDDLPTDGDFIHLGTAVDEYLLGEEIGDKDHPETFGRLWETRQGDIAAVFDDKVSVCEAAVNGFKMAGGSPQIYLVGRNGKYDELRSVLGGRFTTGLRNPALAERVQALKSRGVVVINSFNDIT